MDSGIAALDEMIARLRALGAKDVGARVAVKAAPLVQAELQKTAAAGTRPDGRAWKPKRDGGRPLANAGAAISTRAAGNLIVTTLTGPTVFHHRGLGGKPTRQVIPESGEMPAGVRDAVVDAAREVFDDITRGKS